MLIFKTPKNKSILVFAGSDMTEAKALKKANEHFKVKTDKLEARKGYMFDRGLYWSKPDKTSVKVWAVYKK